MKIRRNTSQGGYNSGQGGYNSRYARGNSRRRYQNDYRDYSDHYNDRYRDWHNNQYYDNNYDGYDDFADTTTGKLVSRMTTKKESKQKTVKCNNFTYDGCFKSGAYRNVKTGEIKIC